MIHPIVKYGDPVLETPTKRVEKFDADFQKLVEDMFESMYAASGVGLAAPQIGLGLRVTQREEEGCLSVPGFRAHVARPQYVTIRAHDVTGKEFEMRGEGLLARAFCHEIDHLNGVLFITHLSMLKRDMIKRKIRKLKKAGEW